MSDHVTNYKSSLAKIMDVFKCGRDYPLRLCLDGKWSLTDIDGVGFLSFQEPGGDVNTFVAVKEKGSPLVYKYSGYIMVVAIDCVKVGYVFRTKNMEEPDGGY